MKTVLNHCHRKVKAGKHLHFSSLQASKNTRDLELPALERSEWGRQRQEIWLPFSFSCKGQFVFVLSREMRDQGEDLVWEGGQLRCHYGSIPPRRRVTSCIRAPFPALYSPQSDPAGACRCLGWDSSDQMARYEPSASLPPLSAPRAAVLFVT